MPPPRRSVAKRPPRRELLVFTEGAVTEEMYIRHWHRRFRDSVNVETHEFHGTPAALVRHAAETKATNEREERRHRGRAHDQVWCVFDIDDHPLLREAIDLATDHGISLAISNPCIELWFLLHFTDQTAYITSQQAQAKAKRYVGGGKGLDGAALNLLTASFPLAKQRAIRLEQKHDGDGTRAPGNPSSSVWQIIDAIAEGRREPQA